MALIGAAVVVVVAHTGWEGLQARKDLDAAQSELDTLFQEIADGRTKAAERTSLRVADRAAEAREETTGPGWWVAARLPRLGESVTAVRTVTDVLAGFSRDALPEVVQLARQLRPDRMRPRDGRIPVDRLESAAPTIADLHRQLAGDRRRVAAIATARLVGPLRDPMRRLQAELTKGVALTRRAAVAAELLPRMLGAREPRTYLALFQNNAEVRATGGIPGAFALITADNGRLRMTAQGGAADLGSYTRPVLPLTRDELQLFGTGLGVYPASSTFTPHFPRTAELVQRQWLRARGLEVDGVLSLDPVGLSYLLEGTGPVRLADKRLLTPGNAPDLLLHEVYQTIPDPEVQNAYFADAARRIFDLVVRGAGSPRELLAGLSRAATEQRLLVWSTRPAEQRQLADYAIGGALPPPGGQRPFIGVFLNNNAADKMTYFLDYEVGVESVSCNDAGRQELRVRFEVGSTAPKNAVSALSPSVLGPPGFGRELGEIRTTVMLYAPARGWVESASLDGRPTLTVDRQHQGFPVSVSTVRLRPGQTRVLDYRVFSGTAQRGDPQVRVTPPAGVGVPVAAPSSAC